MKQILYVATFLVFIISCSKYKGNYYNYVDTESKYNGSCLDYFNSNKEQFDSFLLVLNRVPELMDSIASDSVTVFAPLNNSFALAVTELNKQRLSDGRPPLYLSTIDSANLDTLVSRYIVRGKIMSKDIANFVDGVSVNTVNYNYVMNITYSHLSSSGSQKTGPQNISYADTKGTVYIKYWVVSPTFSIDMETGNGVVNVLSTSHEFGFGEFVTRFNN